MKGSLLLLKHLLEQKEQKSGIKIKKSLQNQNEAY